MNQQTTAGKSPIESILSTFYAAKHNSSPDNFPFSNNNSSIQFAEELKKFMDEIPGGFFIYHADGNEDIIYANKAVPRIFGCDTMEEFQELTGNSFRGLVHPDDLDAVETSIREQIGHSQYDLDYVEYRIIQKNGQIRWVEDYGHFTHSDFAGDIFYVFVGDATNKRQHQLEEQLHKLAIIEGLSSDYEAILFVNLDEDTLLPYRLNSRIENQFNSNTGPSSFRQFCSDYIKTWVCPEDQALVTLTLDPVRIQKNVASLNTYYVNYRIMVEEDIQHFQLRIASACGDECSSLVVIGSRRVDNEIRQEMEQKRLLEETLNHVNRANIAKNTFLANMSHDIRTPLNAITGFTALAHKHLHEPEKLREYIDKIEAAGEQLLSLINDILEISRIESGTLQTEEVPCCLSELLAASLDTLSLEAGKKQISLSIDDSKIKHPYIYGDPDKIKQVLACLGSNAVKYTEEGGWVRISIFEEKMPLNNYSSYRFSVEDNGIGIAPEHLDEIFEPFERVRNTTLSGIPGTGLGLAIVKQLVKLMDGTITVKSTPREGSLFSFTLTLRIQHSQALPSAEARNALLKQISGRKILLVDDNELNLELETELLEDLGFLVDTATDGRIAVERLLKEEPGYYFLILMDIQMPVMDGYETTQVIRSLSDPLLRNIPIIALSANAFDEDRRMARKSGMNAHMAKPLHTERFIEFLMQII